jgi:DNA-binding MarR family transcriptional regulator
MQGSDLTSSKELTSLEITQLEAAMFLVDGAQVRYLRPFFARECSLGQAAKTLKMPIANMHYWVNKMEKLGLIRQTKSVKRKGSPVKYYRSSADEFVVALKRIPTASLEELLEQRERRYIRRMYQGVARALLAHEGEWYAHYFMAGDSPTSNIKPKSGSAEDAELFSYWMPLSLKSEQAKALRAELREVQARYAKLHEENLREKSQDTACAVTHLFSVRER